MVICVIILLWYAMKVEKMVALRQYSTYKDTLDNLQNNVARWWILFIF